MNYNFIKDFHSSRKNRIGASDIPCLIPHPIKQIESLSAFTDDKSIRHAMTALDLYNNKINNIYTPSGFPAEMGHRLEGYALYEFIADNISRDIAVEFLRGYMMHKIEQDNSKNAVNPEPYNNTPFKHNTEVATEWGVAHADCVYDAPDIKNSFLPMKKNENGHWILDNGIFKINMSLPFLIEAKSARYFSARRKEDPYTGYDLSLKEWQGIPLKVYFQVQYQMLLYNVDVCYVSLLFDTSSKHYWQIKANPKHQSELQQLAMYMKNCIDTKTPPKELLMNSKDIQALYPVISDDFRECKGEELQSIIQTAIKYHEAKSQSKIWTQREKEYEEQIAIHLKDTNYIKGNIGGIITDIAKWKETGGGERVAGLKTIREMENGKTIEKYLRRNGLIKNDAVNRKPSIIIKSKELENYE